MKLASKLRRFYHRVQFGREHSSKRGLRSASDNGLYPAFCRKAAANSLLFSQFRRHSVYNQILEHVPQARGQRYLDHVAEHYPDLLERYDDFRINDTVGYPRTFEFEGIGTTSPTTLRYVKVAGQIRELFGENLEGDIAEIGGGYGGQLLVLDQLVGFRRYTIFDLAPVNLLVERYLDCFVLNGGYATTTLNQCAGDHQFDLVISNYAFSELPQAVQQTYIAKVISRSKRGYITMNSGKPGTAFFDGRMTLEQLEAALPAFEIVEENKFGAGEYIIAWGHKTAPKSRARVNTKRH
jgi:hypothetical protein